MMNPAPGLDPQLAALNPKVIDGFPRAASDARGRFGGESQSSRPNFFLTAIC